jgi:uncharacterized protein (DUF952 family)
LRRLAERVIPMEMRTEDLYEHQFPMEVIYHIVPKSYFDSFPSDQPYLPEPYARDGFIHCTRGADLMVMVANRYYLNVQGEFLMLAIDVRALTAPLKYEALDPAVPFPFPHIYGPLNREAIIAVMALMRAKDGTFLVPPLMNQKLDQNSPTH